MRVTFEDLQGCVEQRPGGGIAIHFHRVLLKLGLPQTPLNLRKVVLATHELMESVGATRAPEFDEIGGTNGELVAEAARLVRRIR